MMRLLRLLVPSLAFLACDVGRQVLSAEAPKIPEAAIDRRLNAVWFADDRNGWIVGDKGLCLATADGGATWEKRETGSGATLRDVRFRDALHGWICGDGDPAAPACMRGHILMGPGVQNLSGTILTTEDGGKSWKSGWVSSAFELPAIEISCAPVIQLGVGGSHGHIDGDILRSGDGGKTWGGKRAFRGLFDIRALDDRRWIAVGSPVIVGFFRKHQSPLYLAKDCRALFSRDAGRTWEPSKGSEGNGILRGAAVRQGLPAIGVGDKGSILVSEDSGENWTAVASPTPEDLHAAAYGSGDGKTVLAVGAKGTVLKSPDGGKNWKAIDAGATVDLRDVCPAGDGFIAIGENGTILRLDAKTLKMQR